MKRVIFLTLALAIHNLSLSLLADDFTVQQAVNWHQWRGPSASGVSATANPPTEWSATKNIEWKVKVPGAGSSTPIIWGHRVFLTTAIDTGVVDPTLPKPEDQPDRKFGIVFPNTRHQFVVLCYELTTGKELWRQVVAEAVPNEGHHDDNSFASGSPTTDGNRLYAWFGSVGLFCLDLDGEIVWRREFEKVQTRLSFNEGASPVLHGNRIVINRDNEGQSRIIAIDAETGELAWQRDRDEPSAWATPLIREIEGKVHVVTNASNRVRSYDLSDGSLLWECSGQVSNVTPSPVATNNLVVCLSGYQGSAGFAIPWSARGDISNSNQVAWSVKSGTPYVPSPLLYDESLYFTKSNSAILTCVDVTSGTPIIETTRLPEISRVYASPVGAAGKIYITARDGKTLVLKKSDQLEILATNILGENVDASPAIVGKRLLVRGHQHLYSISE